MFYWEEKKSKRLSFNREKGRSAVSTLFLPFFFFFLLLLASPFDYLSFLECALGTSENAGEPVPRFFVDSSSRTLDRYSSTLQDAQAVHFAVHFADHHSGYTRIRTTYSRHECKTLVSACLPLSTPREQMIRMGTFQEKR